MFCHNFLSVLRNLWDLFFKLNAEFIGGQGF